MIKNLNKLFFIVIIQMIFMANCSGLWKYNTIETDETGQFYKLTVKPSTLYLLIPRNGFEYKGGGTGYFILGNESEHIIVTAWFDPADRFMGMENHWKKTIENKRRQGLPLPHNVKFTKIDKWDTVIYDDNDPQYISSHIRAYYIQAGTWIDVHLSMTRSSDNIETQSKLENILKTIQIKEKES